MIVYDFRRVFIIFFLLLVLLNWAKIHSYWFWIQACVSLCFRPIPHIYIGLLVLSFVCSPMCECICMYSSSFIFRRWYFTQCCFSGLLFWVRIHVVFFRFGALKCFFIFITIHVLKSLQVFTYIPKENMKSCCERVSVLELCRRCRRDHEEKKFHSLFFFLSKFKSGYQHYHKHVHLHSRRTFALWLHYFVFHIIKQLPQLPQIYSMNVR